MQSALNESSYNNAELEKFTYALMHSGMDFSGTEALIDRINAIIELSTLLSMECTTRECLHIIDGTPIINKEAVLCITDFTDLPRDYIVGAFSDKVKAKAFAQRKQHLLGEGTNHRLDFTVYKNGEFINQY
jgi:hypothetical protein